MIRLKESDNRHEKEKKYRKKPLIVTAYQTDVEIDIPTLEGTMHASPGDYIVKGGNGETWPVKESAFFKTYDEVTDGGDIFDNAEL